MPTSSLRKGFVVLDGRLTDLTRRAWARATSSHASAISEVRFKINGVPLTWKTHVDVFTASEGDHLIIAGHFDGTEVQLTTWWNCTKKAGYEPTFWFFWPSLIGFGVLLFGFIAVVGIRGFIVNFRDFIGMALLLLIGLGVSYSEYSQRKAVLAVRARRLQLGQTR